MFIFQIAGYKRSGKTTLVSGLIQFFSEKGFKVASLKHHGHGGTPAAVENTDTRKHEEAGAVMTGVEGEGVLQLTMSKPSWKLDQILSFYQLMEVDVLLIEGYKEHDFDKVVLIRDDHDLPLLDHLSGIKAIMTPLPLKHEDYDIPIFRSDETEAFCEWLGERVEDL
ncbi:molybdopterin-guanine dinucleotide biosynthesis protein B [Bacillus sp. KH172YL63]|uniref:molybdopterin-guanine dinucleotide biosynthesis protein B n=1 Tax=Bacillus sp. KH172YL63 TaxID=2709784 RepID=UPI0013E445D5|nr:molybdopterin-guanine dinucleotide biosynthesis protein B [Bacillus sp. KH172YL63]BCB02489.1 molybdopterin-guanine dinucleotide biosynthesis protein MobB [Bacillus sp. KH172YL63]